MRKAQGESCWRERETDRERERERERDKHGQVRKGVKDEGER